MNFFLAGGFPMFFVLVFGAIAIASSARFALAPAPGRAGPVLAYCGAVAAMSVAGTAFDLVTVARFVGTERPAGDDLITVIVVGGGESMSPLVLGASLVAVALLGAAVGLRRTAG